MVSDGDFTGKAGETALLYGQEGPAPPAIARRPRREGALRPGEAAPRRSHRRQTRQGTEAARCGFLPAALPDARYGRQRRPRPRGRGSACTASTGTRARAERSRARDFLARRRRRGAGRGHRGRRGRRRRSRGVPLLARDLANEPSNVATPEYLAQRAREIAEKYGMELDGSRPRRHRGGGAHGPRYRRPVGLQRAALYRAGAPGRGGTRRPSSSSGRP